MQDAGEPAPEREVPPRFQLAERPEVADGVPEPQPDLVALQRRLRPAHDPVVDEGGEVEPARRDQAVRGGEPRVALDELEPAVALVALELDVGQPSQPHLTEQGAGRLDEVGVPVGDVVAGRPHPERIAADDPLGEMEQVLTRIVDVGVVAAEPVIRTGDPLHEHDLDARLAGLAEGAQELIVIGDEHVLAAELLLEDVRQERLDEQGENQVVAQCLDLLPRLGDPEPRRRDAGGPCRAIGLELVEHRRAARPGRPHRAGTAMRTPRGGGRAH